MPHYRGRYLSHRERMQVRAADDAFRAVLTKFFVAAVIVAVVAGMVAAARSSYYGDKGNTFSPDRKVAVFQDVGETEAGKLYVAYRIKRTEVFRTRHDLGLLGCLPNSVRNYARPQWTSNDDVRLVLDEDRLPIISARIDPAGAAKDKALVSVNTKWFAEMGYGGDPLSCPADLKF